MKILLARDSNIQISKNVLEAAASNSGSGLELLLARDSTIKVSKRVLELSAEFGYLNRVKSVLDRSLDLEPTDDVLEAAARNGNEEEMDEKSSSVEIMRFILARNDKLQISDRVLKSAVQSHSDHFLYEKMKCLLFRPGIVISIEVGFISGLKVSSQAFNKGCEIASSRQFRC